MKSRKLPRIAITMGDPSGIGPEIIVRGLSSGKWKKFCQPLVIGSPLALLRETEALNINIDFIVQDTGMHRSVQEEGVSVFPGEIDLGEEDILYGNLSAKGAQAVINWIQVAVSLAHTGEAEAICTAPINKTVLKERANYPYPGHTEFLAALTGTQSYVMMLAGPKLKVSLVTIHCPLLSVATMLTKGKIVKTISVTNEAFKIDLGVKHPKLAVAGLNPHAGENGKFGTEEIRIIKPAIQQALDNGIDAQGPFPPDTIYFRAFNGEFDAVISMYHDQGLIPLKLVHFFEGVNVTLGLPIIRTSVDHGTAYDIAGKAVARSDSFEEALSLAAFMASNRLRSNRDKSPLYRSKDEI